MRKCLAQTRASQLGPTGPGRGNAAQAPQYGAAAGARRGAAARSRPYAVGTFWGALEDKKRYSYYKEYFGNDISVISKSVSSQSANFEDLKRSD